jgi:hypothetical protein
VTLPHTAGGTGSRSPAGTLRAFGIVLCALVLASALRAQAPETKAKPVIGEVTAVEPGALRLTLKADEGFAVVVTLADGATVLRAKPGAKSLADATPTSLDAVAVGDRLMVRGARSEDGATLAARQVVVMARDDIGRQREQEKAEWRRRGTLGIVTAVDATKGEITLRNGRAAFAGPIVVETGGRKVAFRRYAPDSVKFADAAPSTIEDVRVGDQLRALGDRSPDGERLAAEQIVFGTFRTVSGNVVAVDAARGEVTIRDEESGKRLVAAVGPDTRLRRLPPEMAARFARFGGRPSRAGEETPGGQPRGEGGTAPARPPRADEGTPGRPRGMGGPGFGPEDLLERLPETTLGDLKKGDLILVASTEGTDPARLQSIALVAGLETLRSQTGPRGARSAEIGLPPDLLDLGLSLP